jgi:hypothetical protein
MIRPFVLRAAIAAALFASFGIRPSCADDQTPSAKLLPPNVYFYAAVPDVQEMKTRVKASAFGEMLKDPKLQPTYDQFKEKLSEGAGEIQKNLGVTLEELLKVPSGELAFAICDIPGESVGMVGLVGYGDNQATIDKLVEKAEASLEAKGSERSTEEFEGTEITVYAKEAAEAGKDDLDIDGEAPASGGAGKVAWFQKDQRLVIGNDVPVLEAVLARWDGKHGETFAGSEVYGTILEKTKTDDRTPAIVWYADPMGGLQTAISRAKNIPPQFQIVTGFLPILGLTNLKGIGGSVDVATKDFDSVTKVFFYVETPSSGDLGLLGAFKFTPTEITPPDWATDAATGYFAANWNVEGAVAAVQKLYDQFNGVGGFDQLMQQAANSPTGPKINPRKDLLDQLTGLVQMTTYAPAAPRAVQPGAVATPQPTVIALAVKDEKKMTDVLARLSKAPNFPGEAREFQGATLYEIPVPNQPAGKLAITVDKKNLFFSTDTARLEQILRGGGSPLSQTAEFKKVAKFFPDQVAMLGFQDQRDQLKTIYEALRSGQASQQLQGFDLTTLPPFEDISKYLRQTGSYAVPDDNGALIVSFSLKLAK